MGISSSRVWQEVPRLEYSAVHSRKRVVLMEVKIAVSHKRPKADRKDQRFAYLSAHHFLAFTTNLDRRFRSSA
jgi:hypothetical protein